MIILLTKNLCHILYLWTTLKYIFNTFSDEPGMDGNVKLRVVWCEPIINWPMVVSGLIFYRYYHNHVDDALVGWDQPSFEESRRLAPLYSAPFSCLHWYFSPSSFIARTSKEWNSLPSSVFPPEYDLQFFKRKVNNLMVYLRNLDRTRPD